MASKSRRGTNAQKWSLYTKDGVIDIRLIWSYLRIVLLWLWHYISYIGYLYPGRYVKITRTAYVITQNGDVVYNPTYWERLLNLFRSDASIKRRLLSWIQDLLPNFRISNFTSTWSDGIVLCALIETVCPGSCPRHGMLKPQHKINNCRLGLRLAKKHLGIPPSIITPEEMAKGKDSMEMKMRQFLSLVKYLATQDQHKPLAERIKYISRDSSIDRVISRCKARGSGLKVGNVGKRSKFTITIATDEMMDLLIEISGPRGEFCSEIIRSVVPTHGMGKMFDWEGQGQGQEEIELEDIACKEKQSMHLGKWNSAEMLIRQRSFDGEAKNAPKIPFDYQLIGDGRFLVSYIPRSVGIHTLNIKWQGRGIKGSPFEVAVNKPRERRGSYSIGKENTFSAGDSTSDEASNGGALEADDVYSDSMRAKKVPWGRRVLRQVTNEGPIQKALVKQGTVTRRRVLKRVITKAGQDIVIQEAEDEGEADKSADGDSRSSHGRREAQRTRSNSKPQLGLFETVAHQVYKRHLRQKNSDTEKEAGGDDRHQNEDDKLNNDDFRNAQELETLSEDDRCADVDASKQMSSEGCNLTDSLGRVSEDHTKGVTFESSRSIEKVATKMGEQILEEAIYDAQENSIPLFKDNSKRLNNAHFFRPVSEDSLEGISPPLQEKEGSCESSDAPDRGRNSFRSMDGKKDIAKSLDNPRSSNRGDGAISPLAFDRGRRSPYSQTKKKGVAEAPNKDLLKLPTEKRQVSFERRPSGGSSPAPHPILLAMQTQKFPTTTDPESVLTAEKVQPVSPEKRQSSITQDSQQIDGSQDEDAQGRQNATSQGNIAQSTTNPNSTSEDQPNSNNNTTAASVSISSIDLQVPRVNGSDHVVSLANSKDMDTPCLDVLTTCDDDHSAAKVGPEVTRYGRFQLGKDSVSLQDDALEEGNAKASRRRYHSLKDIGTLGGSLDRIEGAGTTVGPGIVGDSPSNVRDRRNLKILQSPSMKKTCYFNAQKAFSGSDHEKSISFGHDQQTISQSNSIDRGRTGGANSPDSGRGVSDSIGGRSDLSSPRDLPSSASLKDASTDDDTNSSEDVLRVPLRSYSSMPLLRSTQAVDIDSGSESSSQDEQQNKVVPKHRKMRKHNTISGPDPDLLDSAATFTTWKNALEYWTTKPQNLHVGFDDEGLTPTFSSDALTDSRFASSSELVALEFTDRCTQVSASEIKLETNWKGPARYIKFRKKVVKMPHNEIQSSDDEVFAPSDTATRTTKKGESVNLAASARHLHPTQRTPSSSTASYGDTQHTAALHPTRQSTIETGDSGIAEETNGGIPSKVSAAPPRKKMIEGHRVVFRKPYCGRIMLDPMLTSDNVLERRQQRRSPGKIAVTRSRSGTSSRGSAQESDNSVGSRTRNKTVKTAESRKRGIMFSKRRGVRFYSRSSSGSRSSIASSRRISSEIFVGDHTGGTGTSNQDVMTTTIQENDGTSDGIAQSGYDDHWTDLQSGGNSGDDKDNIVIQCEKRKLKFKCECSKYLADKEKYIPFFGELYPSELCRRCREQVTESDKESRDPSCPLAQSTGNQHCASSNRRQNSKDSKETTALVLSEKGDGLALSKSKKGVTCDTGSWTSEPSHKDIPVYPGKDERKLSEKDPSGSNDQFRHLFGVHTPTTENKDLVTCDSALAKGANVKSRRSNYVIDHPGMNEPNNTLTSSSISLDESYSGFGLQRDERNDMLGALNAFSGIAAGDKTMTESNLKSDSVMTNEPSHLFGRKNKFVEISESSPDKDGIKLSLFDQSSNQSESFAIEQNANNDSSDMFNDQQYNSSTRKHHQTVLGVTSVASPECAGIPNVRFTFDCDSHGHTRHGLLRPSQRMTSSTEASEIGNSSDLDDSSAHDHFENTQAGNTASIGSKDHITLPEQSPSNSLDITEKLHVRFGEPKTNRRTQESGSVFPQSELRSERSPDRPFRGFGRHLGYPVAWDNSAASTSMSSLDGPRPFRRQTPMHQDNLNSFDDFLNSLGLRVNDDHTDTHAWRTSGSCSESQKSDPSLNDYKSRSRLTQSTTTTDGSSRMILTDAGVQNGGWHEQLEEVTDESFFCCNETTRQDENEGEDMTSPPNPKNVSAFGSCLSFGQVASKNNFQVKTESAGNGTLSVSVKGPRPHTVTETSVNYTGDDLYEVTYEVTHPGYYIISVRWADINIPNSPFICKVAY